MVSLPDCLLFTLTVAPDPTDIEEKETKQAINTEFWDAANAKLKIITSNYVC